MAQHEYTVPGTHTQEVLFVMEYIKIPKTGGVKYVGVKLESSLQVEMIIPYTKNVVYWVICPAHYPFHPISALWQSLLKPLRNPLWNIPPTSPCNLTRSCQ